MFLNYKFEYKLLQVVTPEYLGHIYNKCYYLIYSVSASQDVKIEPSKILPYRYCKTHSLKHRPGCGVGLIPEMIQVCDYDILIVLVELNTLI